jgi:hypothetical protein
MASTLLAYNKIRVTEYMFIYNDSIEYNEHKNGFIRDTVNSHNSDELFYNSILLAKAYNTTYSFHRAYSKNYIIIGLRN